VPDGEEGMEEGREGGWGGREEVEERRRWRENEGEGIKTELHN